MGLLLVVLDGYAAWYVDLFGVAGRSGPRYAAIVALVTAVVAAGYGAATRLVGPTVAAIVAIQPVAPLLAFPLHPSTASWSLIFAGVATLDLIIVTLPGGLDVSRSSGVSRPTNHGATDLAWMLFGVALAVAGITAVIAEFLVGRASDAALAGAAVIAVTAVVAGGPR